MDNDVLLWLAHYGRTPDSPGYTSPRVAITSTARRGAVAGVKSISNFMQWHQGEVRFAMPSDPGHRPRLAVLVDRHARRGVPGLSGVRP